MATRRLILLRHAKSDWHSGAPSDFERPLNPRGRNDAGRIGRWLHFNGLSPDIICCSSAKRTRETLSLVSAELDTSRAETLFMGELYHANETEIVTVAEEQLNEAESVMLVGHNPGFEMTLMHYCPDLPTPDDGKWMPTACVAVIEFNPGEEPSLRYWQRVADL